MYIIRFDNSIFPDCQMCNAIYVCYELDHSQTIATDWKPAITIKLYPDSLANFWWHTTRKYRKHHQVNNERINLSTNSIELFSNVTKIINCYYPSINPHASEYRCYFHSLLIVSFAAYVTKNKSKTEITCRFIVYQRGHWQARQIMTGRANLCRFIIIKETGRIARVTWSAGW